MSQSIFKTFRGYNFTFSNGIWVVHDDVELKTENELSNSTFTLDNLEFEEEKTN
jgi:hypothetical protein